MRKNLIIPISIGVFLMLISSCAKMKSGNSESGKDAQAVDVSFTVSDNFLKDFSMKSISAKRIGSEMELTLVYSETAGLYFSFFSVPDGETLMYTNRLPKNSTAFKFKVSNKDIMKSEYISMKFEPWDHEVYIGLNMDDLKKAGSIE